MSCYAWGVIKNHFIRHSNYGFVLIKQLLDFRMTKIFYTNVSFLYRPHFVGRDSNCTSSLALQCPLWILCGFLFNSRQKFLRPKNKGLPSGVRRGHRTERHLICKAHEGELRISFRRLENYIPIQFSDLDTLLSVGLYNNEQLYYFQKMKQTLVDSHRLNSLQYRDCKEISQLPLFW